MPSSIRRIDVAGRDVTEYMQTLLRKSGYVFHTSAEKEVVRMIKEKVSYVAADPKREEKEWASGKLAEGKMADYVLPDGNRIKVNLGNSSFLFPALTFARSAQSVSVRQKSCSTQKSSALSILVSIKLSSMPSIAQIWIFASHYMATLCFLVEAH